MRRHTIIGAVAVVAIAAVTQNSLGQWTGGTTGRTAGSIQGGVTQQGTFGSRTIGGGAGIMTGRTMTGTQQLGAGFGQMGTGQIGTGMNIGQQGTGFVGTDAATAGDFIGRAGPGGGLPQAATPRSMNLDQRPQRTAFGQAGAQRTAIGQAGAQRGRTQIAGTQATGEAPATLRPGFEHPRAGAPQADQILTNRLSQMLRMRMPTPVEATVQDGTATLRGFVRSEEQRRLAEQLVRLEPGVWAVNNQLAVEEDPREAQPLARPSPQPFREQPDVIPPGGSTDWLRGDQSPFVPDRPPVPTARSPQPRRDAPAPAGQGRVLPPAPMPDPTAPEPEGDAWGFDDGFADPMPQQRTAPQARWPR